MHYVQQYLEVPNEIHITWNVFKPIWDWLGDRGVFTLPSGNAFDICIHRNNVLYYRLKSKEEIKALPEETIYFFGQPTKAEHRDSMDHLIPRKEGDEIHILPTHDHQGKELDVIEHLCSITEDEFKNLSNTWV